MEIFLYNRHFASILFRVRTNVGEKSPYQNTDQTSIWYDEESESEGSIKVFQCRIKYFQEYPKESQQSPIKVTQKPQNSQKKKFQRKNVSRIPAKHSRKVLKSLRGRRFVLLKVFPNFPKVFPKLNSQEVDWLSTELKFILSRNIHLLHWVYWDSVNFYLCQLTDFLHLSLLFGKLLFLDFFKLVFNKLVGHGVSYFFIWYSYQVIWYSYRSSFGFQPIVNLIFSLVNLIFSRLLWYATFDIRHSTFDIRHFTTSNLIFLASVLRFGYFADCNSVLSVMFLSVPNVWNILCDLTGQYVSKAAEYRTC